MRALTQLYVDGAWATPKEAGTLEVVDPTTERVYATIPDAAPADVDVAVAAARSAFESWWHTEPAARAALLRRVADQIEARGDELAEIEAHEIGMPKHLAARSQVRLGVRAFATAADVLERYHFEDRSSGVVVREPIGVVGAITPWNFPLNQIGSKVAYALAAGCTVVLKPSEVAPVSAFVLAEILDEVGLPAGCFNLVTGLGTTVGEAIAGHPDVDMVSFTGSTQAGRRVAELAARTVKRVALELGGKSPYVILDDADLAKAVPVGVSSAFSNCGQTCSALTRMLVPRPLLGAAEEIARSYAATFTVGDPFDETTRLGPLVSAAQRDRVRAYIQLGIDEGARLVVGGPDAPEGSTRGFFVRPTIFSDVDPAMTIAREEIFGPVLVMIPYDSDDDAIRIANDTPYGLAAGVAGSTDRALHVARSIRAGQVRVNEGYRPDDAPFGGYKQSGHGRELGVHGLEEFLEVKALFV
jgi:acyl-CoA reductase-like NAD-dependent aldehyde dehydrogenase